MTDLKKVSMNNGDKTENCSVRYSQVFVKVFGILSIIMILCFVGAVLLYVSSLGDDYATNSDRITYIIIIAATFLIFIMELGIYFYAKSYQITMTEKGVIAVSTLSNKFFLYDELKEALQNEKVSRKGGKIIFPAKGGNLTVNVRQTDGGEEFCIRLCGKLWTEMPNENDSSKYIKYRPFGILIMVAAIPFTIYFTIGFQSDIRGQIIGGGLFGLWSVVGIILFCISFKE